MKKLLVSCLLFLVTVSAFAAETPTPRVNIFSTSTDWEAVTGLRFGQYEVEFVPDNKLIGNIGLEMYLLDSFPCYGQTDKTQVWIGRNGRDTRNGIRMVCLYPPQTVNFAWRNAARDALQDTTTGILICPNASKNSIKIDLSKCTIGPEWKDVR